MTTSDAAFHLAAMWEAKDIEARRHEERSASARLGGSSKASLRFAARALREECAALDVALAALLPLP